MENQVNKIPTARIRASDRFKNKYNRDLMAAILTEDFYTVEEAEAALDKFMNAGKEEKKTVEETAGEANQ